MAFYLTEQKWRETGEPQGRPLRALMKREPIGTILVGPSGLWREALARILSAAHFRILASVSNVDDPVLSSLARDQSVLLILDVSDDFDTSIKQIESFRKRCTAVRVAVMANQQHLSEIVSAYRAGVNAYLMTVLTCETFIKSLELIMLGVTLFPPEIFTLTSGWQGVGRNGDVPDDGADDERANDDDDDDDDTETIAADVASNEHVQQAATAHTPRLSARQRSILGCLIQGDSNKTIARKMAITEATVKVHVKAILRKIRVHNRTQAAIWAMNAGPFVAPTDEVSRVLQKLSGQPFSSLETAEALSAGNEKTLNPKGGDRTALPNIVHLIPNGIHRKDG